MKTFTNRSEEIFFACCRDRGWIATKIEAPGNRRAPDFIVRTGDTIFVAEVKEFHPRTDGKNTGRHRPAQKLRKAINNARGQLKGLNCPTLLVVLDTTNSGYTSLENIRTALLGEEKIKHASNMQISAIATLIFNDRLWSMEICRNHNSEFPFPEDALANQRDT